MRTEAELIPYHSSDLTGRRVLVFAPHPDDETIGCGGCMAIHASAGDPVRVVFLTNGAQGDVSSSMDKGAYVALRQSEAREACALLGVKDLQFWDYEDRSLAGSRGALSRVIEAIADFGPELIYCPSPLEFHPDHRAACFLVCDALRAWERDCRVAFYEIGQPIRINVLVDISGVMEKKRAALHAYKSQIKERPYHDISLALGRYRSMTLENSTHAEGLSVRDASSVRKAGPFALPFETLDRLSPGPGEAGPLVSVIVRTRNRPALLSHAIRSIASQTYRHLEIVLVNDGGEDVQDEVRSLAGGIPVVSVRHERSRGRAAAANSGLGAAKGDYLNFLDDDDVLYPDHVETLVSCLQARSEDVAYSGVMNAYYRGLPDIAENRFKEEVVFNFPFDADRLLFENYIPAMSVLFSRDALLQAGGGFCEDLDLFEDWDFWVRVSRHFVFHHVDRVTAEYRFYGTQDMETSHRNKYAYDEALARMFERNTPFITGRAWVGFLSGRFVGTGREEEWRQQAEQEAWQRDPADSQWKEPYEALQRQWEELSIRHLECVQVLERIERHPLVRIYRKARRLFKGA
jgi:LmbE family N-acetylglucosaminyl deacetylase/glycosyltransferase involved in cell wall biosynthesis